MLIINNVGLPRFKLKLVQGTPDSVRDKIPCIVDKGGTLVIPTIFIEYIDLPHLRRCERKSVLKIYSINENKAPKGELLEASKPKASKPLKDTPLKQSKVSGKGQVKDTSEVRDA